MLTLYYKPTCAFSRRVMAVIDRLGLEVEMKDVSDNDQYSDELIARGGKLQTPYLVDTDKNVELYESDDIVAHLQASDGSEAVPAKPRVHVSGSTCISCEG